MRERIWSSRFAAPIHRGHTGEPDADRAIPAGWRDVRVISCKRVRDLSGRASDTAPRLYIRRRRRRRKRDGWRGSFTFSPLLFSATAKKKKKRRRRDGRRVTSPVSPRNTAKLCIRSKERNLQHFAPFSPPAIFLLCVFNFFARTYTGRETRRAAPRRADL